jgi:methyl-accepting chemotaxis protein
MKKTQIKTGLIAILLMALVAVFFGYMKAGQAERRARQAQQQIAVQARLHQDKLIKAETETAVSMLQQLYAKVQNKEMTLAKAKVLGADLLRQMKYGQDGYFFADTGEGVNVVLYGRKDVEGKNRYEDVIHGVPYVKDIIAKAKAGGGYTDYWYAKQNGSEPLAKRAYSLYFEPFNWSVGTGYYVDDLSSQLAAKGY